MTPEYLSYCAGDVATTVEVFERLGGLDAMGGPDSYQWREMALMGRLTASNFAKASASTHSSISASHRWCRELVRTGRSGSSGVRLDWR